MFVATFEDGTSSWFEAIRGHGFVPTEGDRYLFEFPDGELQRGSLRAISAIELLSNHRPRLFGVFDPARRTVAVEV
jgi:hypothetical protein